jgi:hypothetical protein
MQYEYATPWQHVGSIRSSPKEKLLPNIDVVRIVGDKATLIPVVNSNETILRNRG